MKPSRIAVRYEGRVQGIGFRFTALNLARDFEVTGYVKNEFDGSVTLIAEGAEDQLTGLLQAIQRSQLARYITNERVRHSAATGEFKVFTVQY